MLGEVMDQIVLTAQDLQVNYLPGDLLYFATTGTGNPSHVGIYVGNNTFIHASGSASKPDKVKLSTLSGYYLNALLGARRF